MFNVKQRIRGSGPARSCIQGGVLDGKVVGPVVRRFCVSCSLTNLCKAVHSPDIISAGEKKNFLNIEIEIFFRKNLIEKLNLTWTKQCALRFYSSLFEVKQSFPINILLLFNRSFTHFACFDLQRFSRGSIINKLNIAIFTFLDH